MKNPLQVRIENAFRNLKSESAHIELPEKTVCYTGEEVFLRTVSANMPDLEAFVVKATAWRSACPNCFFTEFNATVDRTRKWLTDVIGKNPLKILFLMELKGGVMIGHLGLDYVPDQKTFEVGSILKVEKAPKGSMTLALGGLCHWAFSLYPVPYIFLRSFSDNVRAFALYERCGFVEVDRWPVFREERDDERMWVRGKKAHQDTPERIVVFMKKFRELSANLLSAL
jgi:RimJ/RimL family protein N-acetyltransferase